MELWSETNQKQDRHYKYYYTSPDTLTCLKTGACVLFIKGNMVFVVTVNTFYTVSFGHDKPKTLWRFSSNTNSSLHKYHICNNHKKSIECEDCFNVCVLRNVSNLHMQKSVIFPQNKQIQGPFNKLLNKN